MFGLGSVVALVLNEAALTIKEFVSDLNDESEVEQLLYVAEEMSGLRGAGGVKLQDHKRGLRVYVGTFTGRCAVQWMMNNNVVDTVDDAIAMGNRMSHHGVFVCALKKQKKFTNSDRIFKFEPNFDQSLIDHRPVHSDAMTRDALLKMLESAKMDAPELYQTEFTGQALMSLLIEIGACTNKRASKKICSAMLLHHILESANHSDSHVEFEPLSYYSIYEPVSELVPEYSSVTRTSDPVLISPSPLQTPRTTFVRLQGEFDIVPSDCNPRPEQWEFVQSFGDDASVYEYPNADDLITALEFDATGKLLAIGDRAGRVSVVEQMYSKDQSLALEYQFRGEFQCFEPEFDTLMVVNVSPLITSMKWWPNTHRPTLLTSNSETVKLWHLGSKWHHPKPFSAMSRRSTPKRAQPDEESHESEGIFPVKKREFRKGHSFNIHSVAINSDLETFLSCDDLSVCIWNINRADECFNVINLKPKTREDEGDMMIKDTITTASFHPSHCNQLMYGDSGGVIRIADMREKALLDNCASVTLRGASTKNFANKAYTQIANSISDAKFSENGRFILSRDLMRMRVWDLNMPGRPVSEDEIHPFLWKHMSMMAHNDALFDRFTCSADSAGRNYVTGSYDDTFCIRSRYHRTSTTIKASDESKSSKFVSVRAGDKEQNMKNLIKPQETTVHPNTLSQKILHAAWHPEYQAVAVAGLYKLWIYQARTTQAQALTEIGV